VEVHLTGAPCDVPGGIYDEKMLEGGDAFEKVTETTEELVEDLASGRGQCYASVVERIV
jgi:hypothetical protein